MSRNLLGLSRLVTAVATNTTYTAWKAPSQLNYGLEGCKTANYDSISHEIDGRGARTTQILLAEGRWEVTKGSFVVMMSISAERNDYYIQELASAF